MGVAEVMLVADHTRVPRPPTVVAVPGSEKLVPVADSLEWDEPCCIWRGLHVHPLFVVVMVIFPA